MGETDSMHVVEDKSPVISLEKPEGMRPLGRPMCKSEDIKLVN
jgi:hypothetical protein